MDCDRSCLWVIEAVLHRDGAGVCWCSDPVVSAGFVGELRRIGQVILVCRLIDGEPPAGAFALDGARIEISGLPFYKGLGGFLSVFPVLVRRLYHLSGQTSIGLLRLPGALSTIAGLAMLIRGTPFAVQMSGDPDTVLRAQGFSWFERSLRVPLSAATRLLCRKASAITYVTKAALQRSYPAGPESAQFSFANVRLDVEDYRAAGTVGHLANRPVLAFCGSLAQRYKGLDILLTAIARLVAGGLDAQLVVIGEGRERFAMEQLAARLGITGQVAFKGQLGRDQVIAEFRRADIFIMPSRTEGLPRALIEAMAQALPCIASDVGGIPELLEPDALVPIDDVAALARKIANVIGDADRMAAMGQRNLATAQGFAAERIDAERARFVSAMITIVNRTGPTPGA